MDGTGGKLSISTGAAVTAGKQCALEAESCTYGNEFYIFVKAKRYRRKFKICSGEEVLGS